VNKDIENMSQFVSLHLPAYRVFSMIAVREMLCTVPLLNL